MDVGFIGLGNIGGPCAKHLLDAGHRVTVFDIDEAAAEIGTPPPLTRAAHDVLARSVDAGLGAKCFLGAMETLEAEAGFTAPVPPPVDAP